MNIYVANLDWAVDDSGLMEVFLPFGDVSSSKVIRDRENGRSRGFGFVEMPNKEEAEKAIAELDQREIFGRPLKVVKAKPREKKPQTMSFDRDVSYRPKPFKG